MRPRLFFSWLLVVLLWHASIAAEQSAPQSIILATTTSLDNSGLLAKILPVFTKETGITVHVLAQGTGKALQTAASDRQDDDVQRPYENAQNMHGGRGRVLCCVCSGHGECGAR